MDRFRGGLSRLCRESGTECLEDRLRQARRALFAADQAHFAAFPHDWRLRCISLPPMAIQEVRITSLGELIDQVTPTEPDPKTGRHRDTGVYRGAADAGRPLLTSLDRLGGVDPPHAKTGLEEHILRNFIRY